MPQTSRPATGVDYPRRRLARPPTRPLVPWVTIPARTHAQEKSSLTLVGSRVRHGQRGVEGRGPVRVPLSPPSCAAYRRVLSLGDLAVDLWDGRRDIHIPPVTSHVPFASGISTIGSLSTFAVLVRSLFFFNDLSVPPSFVTRTSTWVLFAIKRTVPSFLYSIINPSSIITNLPTVPSNNITLRSRERDIQDRPQRRDICTTTTTESTTRPFSCTRNKTQSSSLSTQEPNPQSFGPTPDQTTSPARQPITEQRV
jgi:hypothetical protein